MQLIDCEVKFNTFFDSIPRYGIIGLDTEFQRTKTYYPILSLIQVSLDSDNIFLLDVLALESNLVKKFLEYIVDNNFEIIIHSCEQDVLGIFYKYNVVLKNIFDTQIYARDIFEYDIGYGNLCKELFGIEIDKNCQYSDWLKRPLTEEMINYAGMDVFHLHRLREILLEKIKIVENTKDKCRELEDESRYLLNPLSGWKVFERKLKNTHRPFKDVIKTMYQKREIIAERNNVIRKYVMRDEILIAIAEKVFYKHELKNLRISKYAKTQDFLS